MHRGLDFLSIGEVLIQLNSLTPGPLRYSKYFEVHVAGSEFNVMVALSKLGYRTGFITRLGRDEFGEMIIRTMRGEGIDVSRVKFMDNAPTGIYFIQRHYPIPGKSTVFYYRHGSAASYMDETDVQEDYVKSAKAIFLTGITPALSETCYRAVKKMREIALENGVTVYFDTNIRLKLWREVEKARSMLLPLLEYSKIVFTNKEDLKLLFPGLSIDQATAKLFDMNVEMVVVKKGEEGSTVYTRSGEVIEGRPYQAPVVEDVIGAGDSFDAVFIASIERGLPIEQATRLANLAGMIVVTTRGDIESQPDWNALEALKRYFDEKVEALR
ncbi:MAG: sugar kinase [Desulfurococcaceae archaeon]